MRIAIIIGCLHFGGAERVATSLAKWLILNGHEVAFLLTKQRMEKDKEYEIPDDVGIYVCYHPNDLKLIQNMRKIFKEYRPDLALLMGTPICVYGIPALMGLHIPIVVSERSSPNNARIKKSTRYISNSLMKYADAYVFQTQGAKSYFSESIQKKGEVIPNPVIVEDLPNVYHGIREKRVVAVGRMIHEKNYPMLIKAFFEFHRSHQDYVLDIYGDGAERDTLNSLIGNLGLNTCVNLYHARPNVLDEIRKADIFVLTSDLEGMPNALIEAMALGLACISTDCPSGGPRDLIQNEINGILIPVNNPEILTEKLCYLADNDKERRKLGNNASSIREKLDINVIGRKWELVFKNVVQNKE